MKTLFEKMRKNRYHRVQVENIKRWRIEDQAAGLSSQAQSMTAQESNMYGQQRAQAISQRQIRGAALGGGGGCA